MKLYLKQIRPMHYSPGMQGFSERLIPVEEGNIWYSEEYENKLREKFEPIIKEKDPWGSLKFEERYVDVSKIQPLTRI